MQTANMTLFTTALIVAVAALARANHLSGTTAAPDAGEASGAGAKCGTFVMVPMDATPQCPFDGMFAKACDLQSTCLFCGSGCLQYDAQTIQQRGLVDVNNVPCNEVCCSGNGAAENDYFAKRCRSLQGEAGTTAANESGTTAAPATTVTAGHTGSVTTCSACKVLYEAGKAVDWCEPGGARPGYCETEGSRTTCRHLKGDWQDCASKWASWTPDTTTAPATPTGMHALAMRPTAQAFTLVATRFHGWGGVGAMIFRSRGVQCLATPCPPRWCPRL